MRPMPQDEYRHRAHAPLRCMQRLQPSSLFAHSERVEDEGVAERRPPFDTRAYPNCIRPILSQSFRVRLPESSGG